MILTIYILASWLLLNILYFFPKKNRFIVSAFVFMVIAIITRNEYTILGLNLQYIQLPKTANLFIAFVLYRSLIYPIVLVLFVNMFSIVDKWISKAAVIFGTFSFLWIAEYITVRIDLIQYLKWNIFYHSLIILFYILVAYLCNLLMNSLLKKVIRS